MSRVPGHSTCQCDGCKPGKREGEAVMIETYTDGEARAIRKMIPLYTVEIHFSDEDEGYIATVSNLPGCSAFGKTRAEAAKEIEPAMEAWIDGRMNAYRTPSKKVTPKPPKTR